MITVEPLVADVLIDTDVFVDHLRGAAELRPGRHRIHYSVITRTGSTSNPSEASDSAP